MCLDSSFCIWMSNCSGTLAEKNYLCSNVLPLLLYQRTVGCIYVGLLLGFLLCSIEFSILWPIPHCLDYCTYLYYLKWFGGVCSSLSILC